MQRVCMVGGTGYVGAPLIRRLCADGFQVSAVARPQSVAKVPPGCPIVIGSALDSRTWQDQVPAGSVFVHLAGVAHPAPWKAAQFRAIDLVSLEQSVAAARRAKVAHFVFVMTCSP